MDEAEAPHQQATSANKRSEASNALAVTISQANLERFGRSLSGISSAQLDQLGKAAAKFSTAQFNQLAKAAAKISTAQFAAKFSTAQFNQLAKAAAKISTVQFDQFGKALAALTIPTQKFELLSQSLAALSNTQLDRSSKVAAAAALAWANQTQVSQLIEASIQALATRASNVAFETVRHQLGEFAITEPPDDEALDQLRDAARQAVTALPRRDRIPSTELIEGLESLRGQEVGSDDTTNVMRILLIVGLVIAFLAGQRPIVENAFEDFALAGSALAHVWQYMLAVTWATALVIRMKGLKDR